jgi:hypothetical protein
MRVALLTAVFFAACGPATAEIVTPNHLDCNFNETTQAMVCPQVAPEIAREIAMPTGRSSAEPAPAPAAVVPTADPSKGSAEWNAACAAKYKSFDAATGMYKSYTGKQRPCI